MSDPVTNIEIEDVLSSIRRLVSDEARALEKNEEAPSFSSEIPPQAVELEVEKSNHRPEPVAHEAAPALVLTAALRIVPEQDVDAENKASDEEREVVAPETNDAALILSTEEYAPDHQQVLAEEPSEREELPVVDGVADGEEHIVDEAHFAPEDQVQDPEYSEYVESDDTAEEEQASDDTPAEPVTIEDKIAALEALISRTDTEFEPDGAEDGANAARDGQSLPWEDSVPQSPIVQNETLPDPEGASQTAAFQDNATRFERAHSEAVETAQSEIAMNASETLLQSEDVSGVLDEEALRDMVAEIVRQELQGPLGERITRNVRKLVRREIYRALAANELD